MKPPRQDDMVNIQRIDLASDTHVVPEFDGEPEHEDCVSCWCEPDLTYADAFTGKRIWTHKRRN